MRGVRGNLADNGRNRGDLRGSRGACVNLSDNAVRAGHGLPRERRRASEFSKSLGGREQGPEGAFIGPILSPASRDAVQRVNHGTISRHALRAYSVALGKAAARGLLTMAEVRRRIERAVYEGVLS